jgi:hypothetical protein
VLNTRAASTFCALFCSFTSPLFVAVPTL